MDKNNKGMGILSFFRKKKKIATEMVDVDASPEQILFAKKALEIIEPSIKNFGFVRDKFKIEKHFSTIIFRKNKRYIKIRSTTYPTDFPYIYNIILGEGDSENFFEWDWNSIPLWKLKQKIAPALKAHEYSFPPIEKMEYSLENANKELLKYGAEFLNGDLSLFEEVRKEANKNREPYKILTPNKDGGYDITEESKSVEQKKKYS